MNLCLCGSEASYPHAPDCPYPMFFGTPETDAAWELARRRRPGRFVPVDHPRPGQHLQCVGCLRMISATVLMADLDGPAFVAYWCPACLIPSDARMADAYRRAAS